MPLGLEVMVLPRVAPGHGACAVPGGTATHQASEDGVRDRHSWAHTEPHLLTWGCSGKQYTGASGPESWGSGQFRHTEGTNGGEFGGYTTGAKVASLPAGPALSARQLGLLTTTRMCLARSLELPIRKSEKAVCGSQRRHRLVTETFPHLRLTGARGLADTGGQGAWVVDQVGVGRGCCWASRLHSHQHRTSCSESGC